MTSTLQHTVDVFESQFAVNHLGHFALTNPLLRQITGRVVTVSSSVHGSAHIDFDDLQWEPRPYSPFGAYGQSKLANLLFTSELQRRLTAVGSGVIATAAHPQQRKKQGRTRGDHPAARAPPVRGPVRRLRRHGPAPSRTGPAGRDEPVRPTHRTAQGDAGRTPVRVAGAAGCVLADPTGVCCRHGAEGAGRGCEAVRPLHGLVADASDCGTSMEVRRTSLRRGIDDATAVMACSADSSRNMAAASGTTTKLTTNAAPRDRPSRHECNSSAASTCGDVGLAGLVSCLAP